MKIPDHPWILHTKTKRWSHSSMIQIVLILPSYPAKPKPRVRIDGYLKNVKSESIERIHERRTKACLLHKFEGQISCSLITQSVLGNSSHLIKSGCCEICNSIKHSCVGDL